MLITPDILKAGTMPESVRAVQIDELHKMSALMGPHDADMAGGVLLAAGMGFSFNAQQPIPLHLMVRFRSPQLPFSLVKVAGPRSHNLGTCAERSCSDRSSLDELW